METEPRPHLIICMPVRMLRPTDVLPPGSETRWCSICSEPLWVAPSGLAQNAIPVCMPCAPGAIRARGDKPGVVSAETIEELHAAGLTDREIEGTNRLVQAMLEPDA